MKAQSSLPSIILLLAAVAAGQQDSEWPFYGRDSGAANIFRYFYHQPQERQGSESCVDLSYGRSSPAQERTPHRAGENYPLFIDNTLFISTPTGRVAALNPETGVEKWSFD